MGFTRERPKREFLFDDGKRFLMSGAQAHMKGECAQPWKGCSSRVLLITVGFWVNSYGSIEQKRNSIPPRLRWCCCCRCYLTFIRKMTGWEYTTKHQRASLYITITREYNSYIYVSSIEGFLNLNSKDLCMMYHVLCQV